MTTRNRLSLREQEEVAKALSAGIAKACRLSGYPQDSEQYYPFAFGSLLPVLAALAAGDRDQRRAALVRLRALVAEGRAASGG